MKLELVELERARRRMKLKVGEPLRRKEEKL